MHRAPGTGDGVKGPTGGAGACASMHAANGAVGRRVAQLPNGSRRAGRAGSRRQCCSRLLRLADLREGRERDDGKGMCASYQQIDCASVGAVVSKASCWTSRGASVLTALERPQRRSLLPAGARVCMFAPGTGAAPATPAPGLSPRSHICAGTGRTAATPAGTAPLPHLHRDCASSCGLPRIFRRA